LNIISEGKNRYRIPKHGGMKVDVVIFVNDKLYLQMLCDESLKQLVNAACLPGVVGNIYGMPDIHEGFGLPIGGVMATDPEKGVISAGAVGMDINCGVRLLKTGVSADELKSPLLRKLMEKIEEYVPTGVGKKRHHNNVDRHIFAKVVTVGASAVVEQGFGSSEDLECTEEYGCLTGADLQVVSKKATERGIMQLGTLGGGNHFIEIQEITDIYDQKIAANFGLFAGQAVIMIHTGSRGFGHQICNDYTEILWKAAKRHGIDVPVKGLACAPVASEEGKSYYAAMACAVNFAFSNRQIITSDVRKACREVLGIDDLKVLYDVAHNIAKLEPYKKTEVMVHRKGATRALAPGHSSNPKVYMETGHPVLIPGSMGTSSYVLTGTELASETFYSVNHGAGRVMSRTAAYRDLSAEEFEYRMKGILYNTRNLKKIIDEAPQAYKDIDSVVDTLAEIGKTRKVARMRPLAVIKGKD
jgi:tRNA-splicing ligase RtcB